ncbi:MAG: hypothetical protein ACI867_000282, partial [Glaciecola sp.]
MRPIRSIAAALAIGVTAGVAGVAAGPTPGGFTSDNVEWVTYIPFDIGSATGMTIRGDMAFVTSWRAVSVYDITDRRNPQLLNTTPFGFRFENEDVAGNDEILIFSETLPQGTLHIYDITNPQLGVPLTEIATIEGAGDHTSECILNCEYVYGSEGTMTYVGQTAENAVDAKLLDTNWMELMGTGVFSNHDVEVFNDEGYFVTTPISQDFHVVDATDPLNPVVLGRGQHPDPSSWLYHSGDWFRGGQDKFTLMQGEQNAQPQCGEGNGPIVLHEAENKLFDPETNLLFPGVREEAIAVNKRVAAGSESAAADYPYQSTIRDVYAVGNGTYQDGSPAVNGLGCSAHWFQEQPDWKDGGLVAVGYYEHGTRFL